MANNLINEKEAFRIILQNKYVIYGAQGIALGAYKAYQVVYPELYIQCFLVTNAENNASTLGGLPVVELNKYIERLNRSRSSSEFGT